MREVKDKAFGEKGAAIGHNTNTDKADKACVKRVSELEAERQVLAGEIKDILNEHKNAHGTPKGSIRKAVKLLDMTAEQFQAKKEVDNRAIKIVQLFVEPDGQYSWLKEGEAA
jgi:uncharacterized protein (UPF0335 family)